MDERVRNRDMNVRESAAKEKKTQNLHRTRPRPLPRQVAQAVGFEFFFVWVRCVSEGRQGVREEGRGDVGRGDVRLG